jgi:hypothetical protein
MIKGQLRVKGINIDAVFSIEHATSFYTFSFKVINQIPRSIAAQFDSAITLEYFNRSYRLISSSTPFLNLHSQTLYIRGRIANSNNKVSRDITEDMRLSLYKLSIFRLLLVKFNYNVIL